MKIVLLSLVGILLAGLVAVGLVAMRPQAVRVPVEPPALLVDVAVAQREPVTFQVRSHGVVTARTRTTLVSRADR